MVSRGLQQPRRHRPAGCHRYARRAPPAPPPPVADAGAAPARGGPVVATPFRERRDLEQYFWTPDTVARLVAATALSEAGSPGCLAAPTLAAAWLDAPPPGAARRVVPLWDIDWRFAYLPGYRYWDLTAPLPPRAGPGGGGDSVSAGVVACGGADDDDDDDDDVGCDGGSGHCRVLVCDPPFFTVSIPQLVASILYLTGAEAGDGIGGAAGSGRTKLLIGYLRREAPPLLAALRPAFPGLRRTAFPLSYGHIKANKWRNFALYANVDLPGVRRLRTDD